MDGTKRRAAILATLNERRGPITGTELSKMYDVSRQVIVQDVALLRAQGETIISTADGYLTYTIKDDTKKRVFCVSHPEEAIQDELFCIVDNGGHLLNIIVDHVLYGQISVDLHLGSRRQVYDFMKKTQNGDFVPLMSLTKGAHYHTVEADSEAILDDIEKELRDKGYLVVL